MACLFPITIANPKRLTSRDFAFIPVPCGKCPDCLMRRANSWAFRLMQDYKHVDNGYFLTFTYADDQAVRSKNGYLNLNKKHFQDFMKRLRKSYAYRAINPLTGRAKWFYDKVPNIKYFACGEYGSKTERPHYHAVMFNVDLDKVEKAWTKGGIYSGTVTYESVFYVIKYMHKGNLIPKHQYDDRLPEFQLFSKGIGKSYLNDPVIEYHKADLKRMYVTFPGGYKKPMPRYYRERIYDEKQRHIQAHLAQEMVLENERKSMQDYASRNGSTDLYYRSQAESKRAALKNFRKNLDNTRNTL